MMKARTSHRRLQGRLSNSVVDRHGRRRRWRRSNSGVMTARVVTQASPKASQQFRRDDGTKSSRGRRQGRRSNPGVMTARVVTQASLKASQQFRREDSTGRHAGAAEGVAAIQAWQYSRDDLGACQSNQTESWTGRTSTTPRS